MSAAKHTPGPWQRSGVRMKLGEEDCLRVGPDDFPIAFLPIGRRPNEQAGAIADATLIASCPDLLQMLHECAEYIAALNGEQDDYCQRARALIARATGEVK